MAARVLDQIARTRSALRVRLWELRTRAVLRRANIDLELVMTGSPTFSTPPVIEPTLQHLGEDRSAGGRGSLRIELGSWVHLGRNTVIEVMPGTRNVLRLGDGVRCFGNVRVVLFGGEIDVGAHTRVRDGVMLKSSGRLRCGEHVILQSFTMLHCHQDIQIGAWTTLAERVSVLDSDHLADGSDTYTQDQPLAVAPVRIATNAWIGANSVVLRGAVLGRNSVVAAGSLVRSGEYPPGSLIAGVPATVKKVLPGAEGATPSGDATASFAPTNDTPSGDEGA